MAAPTTRSVLGPYEQGYKTGYDAAADIFKKRLKDREAELYQIIKAYEEGFKKISLIVDPDKGEY